MKFRRFNLFRTKPMIILIGSVIQFSNEIDIILQIATSIKIHFFPQLSPYYFYSFLTMLQLLCLSCWKHKFLFLLLPFRMQSIDIRRRRERWWWNNSNHINLFFFFFFPLGNVWLYYHLLFRVFLLLVHKKLNFHSKNSSDQMFYYTTIKL